MTRPWLWASSKIIYGPPVTRYYHLGAQAGILRRVTCLLASWPEALVGIPGGRLYGIKPFVQSNKDASVELCNLTVDVIGCVTVSASEGIMG
jgi:hypothetical protein